MPINFKKIVSPTPASSDPYADAVRQRAMADALQKQAVTPRNFGTANRGQAITMGLTQLAEALLARRAGRQATGAENTALQGTRTANEAIANSLGAQGQIGGIDQAPESQATQDFRNQYGIAAPEDEDTGPVALQSKYVSPTTEGAINTGAKPLVDALAGQDPRVANQFLTQMQLTKLSPPPPTFEGVPAGGGVVNKSTGEITGIVPDKPSPDSLQATEEGLVFHKTGPQAGQFTDSNGNIISSDQVAARHAANAGAQTAATAAASNAAKLSALPKDSLDYWVEWSLQHGGQAPPGSRSPQFLMQFGQAMKQRAVSDGNTLAAQVADSVVKKSLQPAMAQTEKQIGANAGFLRTMETNIGDADALAQQIGGANSPVMNRIFNSWKRGVSTDPADTKAIAALDSWNNAIQGESGKIASGGVGSVSAASDAQLAKALERMNSAQTYSGWRSAADVAIKEGHNRMSGLNSTMNDFKQQSMGQGGGPAAAPVAATGGPVKITGDSDYAALASGTQFVGPDGKTRTKP
jgi:hypothetical protein